MPYGTDPTNPYYAWNAETGVFLDNTPDIFLSVATLMVSTRDPMPANAQAGCMWQDRWCIGLANLLFISWLTAANDTAPLMTTLVQNLDDPDRQIEGATFPISADPTDTIVQLIPYGTPVAAGNAFGGGLLVLCERSVWMVSGADPTDFSVRQYDYTEGVGLVALRGCARTSANQVIFMGPDRLHVFPPAHDDPMRDIGLRIQPQLYPVSPQALQSPVGFAGSWMAYHDSRLYLGCPAPAATPQTTNNVIWVFDFHVGGWTRWTGMAMTSGAGEPPNVATATPRALFLYGLNGQVYQVGPGTVDVEAGGVGAPGGTAIPFVITVHGMRPGFFYRYKLHPLFYMWARLEWCMIEMVMTGTLKFMAQAWTAGTGAEAYNPVTVPGLADGGISLPGLSPIGGACSVQTYVLAGQGRPFRKPFPSGLVEGQVVTLTLSGSVSGPAYLRGVRGFISGTTTEDA